MKVVKAAAVQLSPVLYSREGSQLLFDPDGTLIQRLPRFCDDRQRGNTMV